MSCVSLSGIVYVNMAEFVRSPEYSLFILLKTVFVINVVSRALHTANRDREEERDFSV